MTQSKEQERCCPKCNSNSNVYSKMLLLEGILKPDTNRSSLRIDQLKDEFIGKPPLEQFIKGFFCEKCDCGFIPDGYFETNWQS